MILEANISKTTGDTGFVPKDHQLVGNGLCRVELSRDRWRHVSSLLIRNSIRHLFATFRMDKITWKYRKTANIIEKNFSLSHC